MSLFFALACLFVLFLLRILLRREWIAAATFVSIGTALHVLNSDSVLACFLAALVWGATYFILVRFGLLAATTTLLFSALLDYFPITPELSAWYSGIGLAGVVLMLAFAAYAFHTSLGGRPMFQAKLLED